MSGNNAPAEQNAALQAKFKTGLALHQQGRLAEAAKIYEDVLAQDARHAAALHCLGGIAYQTGDLSKAVELISSAVRINPGIAATDIYRAAALNQLNRHDEALAICAEALRLKSDFAETHYNRGNAFYGLGRLNEALASYGNAVELKPSFAEAWSNRGNVLQNLGRLDEALASADKAIALKLNYAQAWYNRGNVLYDLGRLDEALAAYNKAIELKKDYAQVWYNRGKALGDLRRRDEALISYDKAIALKSDYAQAWCNRGNVLNDLERFNEALASYDRAIALKPDYAEAWSNRGTALQYLYRLDEALANHARALDLKPDYAEAWCNRGSVLNTVNRPEEAIVSFDKAIALKPDFAQAHFNRAITELSTGAMARGWQDFEWRRKIVDMSGSRVFPRPSLTSIEEARGRTVLVHYEHGFGDTLQFYRFVEPLQQAGARILLHVQEELKSLVAAPGIAFVDIDDPSLAYDYHIPLMSLPFVLGTTLETIAPKMPYLSADADRVQAWRTRLGEDGFKVGICWMGSLAHIKGRNTRFFSADCFEPLSRQPGVRLISLQKGDGEKQLASLPAGMTVETLGEEFASFADTAAIVKNLDLVISTDTALVHVAAAQDVPTWVAIQHVADWRWMRDRTDSPWYPSVRLFRQKTDGDWTGVFDEISHALMQILDRG